MNAEALTHQIINLKDFVQRWSQKAEKEAKKDSLENVFDEFITRYIIYNSLCKVCALQYNSKGDKKIATETIVLFMQDNRISLFHELKDPAIKIAEAIDHGYFKIGIKGMADEVLKQKLKESDEDAFFKALLLCIYQIRCNLFHGDKEFIWRQQYLLKPASEILSVINKEVFNTLTSRESIID